MTNLNVMTTPNLLRFGVKATGGGLLIVLAVYAAVCVVAWRHPDLGDV